MKKLLIIDDEVNMRKVLGILFRREGYAVETASHGKEAVHILQNNQDFDLVISDLKMPVMDGIELLKFIKRLELNIPVILLTAYGSISEAVDAMKLGAVDFITKPFNREDLKQIVYRTLYGEQMNEPENPDLYRNDEGVIYSSGKMRKIMEMVRKIAPSDLSILLTGESGTGKGIIAKAIHNYSFSGRSAPFVSINCPAVPESLLESELFGYKKGAFTGAVKDFPGKISMADGGTLFLDEIGDLSLSVQSKLLKLLEEGTYEPLGSTAERQAHIRIVSATNQPLETMIKEKKFREDLYYRINSFILSIPPLRERKEDIIPLSSYFLDKFSRENKKQVLSIDDAGKEMLLRYSWPGNIRELRNVIHRSVILSPGKILDTSAFPETASREKAGTFSEAEKKLLLEALKKESGNISAAARELGISRGSLRHRIKKYNLRIGLN